MKQLFLVIGILLSQTSIAPFLTPGSGLSASDDANKGIFFSDINQDKIISVPLAGNAFVTRQMPDGTELITENGLANWTNGNTVISIYFRLEQTGKLNLSLRAKVPSGKSTIKITVNGKSFLKTLEGKKYSNYNIGSILINHKGYVKADLSGVGKTGNYFADVSEIMISGPAAKAALFANNPINFYWSRRGPSVHLRYAAPANTEWFYNEVTVPPGEDKIGSYFMSNGFDGGYFGIQVNSATERKVLFSVWDPAVGKTTLVKKGAGVVDNNFGGEGTGGQSYLVYNWKAGTTYKFLTRGKPDGTNTVYSSWFYAPEKNEWLFIAAWKRPNTNSYLTGLYSFLENFIDLNGWQGRKAYYHNQWIKTATGNWTEITEADLTADPTATNDQRKDYAGGVENGRFFLKNCGFFDNFVNYHTHFTRTATGITPVITAK